MTGSGFRFRPLYTQPCDVDRVRKTDRQTHTYTHKHIQMHTYTLRHTQTVIGTGRVDSVRTAKWKEGRKRKKHYPISIGSKDYKVAANEEVVRL